MLTLACETADAEAIDSLPQTWGSEREAGSYPAEAKRYSELVERLQALNAQRARIKADTNRLRHIHDLLQPFKSDDEGYGVQENLITRGGEVEVELERMRMLLARVGARLGHLLEQDGQTTSSSLHKDDGAFMVDHVEVEEKRKVDDLLMHF
ncbi:hypothetical protein VTK73DRAFT_10349 [Phialemonium thermophilum]|uniref:Uncharacterized protein n=1 Tax=Phialemonium thermophilum TaxID=223376 RepID=A0ABR3VX55_9PEZI